MIERECPHCGAILVQTPRVDACDNCDFYDYYPDAAELRSRATNEADDEGGKT